MLISRFVVSAVCLFLLAPAMNAQQPAGAPAADTTTNDAVKTMISRLELEHYKATIKGLTQFGDRRQGTERNRKAVDWIEAQLKSYGCINTERVIFEYNPPPPNPNAGGQRSTSPFGPSGARIRGYRIPER